MQDELLRGARCNQPGAKCKSPYATTAPKQTPLSREGTDLSVRLFDAAAGLNFLPPLHPSIRLTAAGSRAEVKIGAEGGWAHRSGGDGYVTFL